jgi:hypothetical protein
MRHSAESIFIIEYLREYEFIFETVLAHESGGLGVLIDEKNWGSKISWDCPFKESAAERGAVTMDMITDIWKTISSPTLAVTFKLFRSLQEGGRKGGSGKES